MQQRRLQSLQDKLVAYVSAHPDVVDDLLQFMDEAVREVLLQRPRELDLHTATLLCDRIKYLSTTRIVHRAREVVRCRGKVIYTERAAHAKSNFIWQTGRGRMRVYHCPLCNGHHLTHQELRDDRAVA